MEIRYNVTGAKRKELVKVISDATGARAEYKFMPTCNYEIDYFTVTKDGTLLFDDCADSEEVEQVLEAIRYVDLVIPENNWDQKISDVQDYKIDTFVMGSDWEGKFDFLKDYCEVVYLPRTEGISTTQIKEDLNKKDMTAKGDK